VAFLSRSTAASSAAWTPTRYREARIDLAGDDHLLLYSDGLVERRREYLDTGLDALRRAAESSSSDPQACSRTC
jgi:chemotaxis family two-component system sensor kinase Cph1